MNPHQRMLNTAVEVAPEFAKSVLVTATLKDGSQVVGGLVNYSANWVQIRLSKPWRTNDPGDAIGLPFQAIERLAYVSMFRESA